MVIRSTLGDLGRKTTSPSLIALERSTEAQLESPTDEGKL